MYMYTVQNRVNKEYDAVLDASLSVTDAPSEPEWVQVYTGIARGLGNLNTNITECVEDGNETVATFKAAFDAFENRQIYDGKSGRLPFISHPPCGKLNLKKQNKTKPCSSFIYL